MAKGVLVVCNLKIVYAEGSHRLLLVRLPIFVFILTKVMKTQVIPQFIVVYSFFL